MISGAGGVQSIEAVVLLLLVFVALFAALARKLKVPYPILLVVAGLLLGFVPGMPRINLDPDIVFLVFLPPLLHAAAWSLSWREFQRNFSSIAKLAVGLVFFTILGLAMTAGKLLPGFDWRSAILLGAVVAATDAIAATSIARRLGLPQHIVEILEAESLVNDGTGLVALQFGLLVLLTGRTPSPVETAGRLIFLIGGGVLIGLMVGAVVAWFEKWVDDGGIEIVISILVPYATYLLGARLKVSGVIAVIACSMYMSRKSVTYMTPGVRLQAAAVWDALTFILNGIVFVLIGLQLPYVMGQIHGLSRSVLLRYGVGFSLAMIAVRMLWVFGEMYLSYLIRRRTQGRAHRSAASRRSLHHRVGRYAGSAVTGSRNLTAVYPRSTKHDYLSGVLPDLRHACDSGIDHACGHPAVGIVRGKTIARRRTGGAADAASGCHRSSESPARQA